MQYISRNWFGHDDGSESSDANTIIPALREKFLVHFRWCGRCISRRQQRQALIKLDDRLLRDIGVGRREAEIEGSKPFWK